MFLPLTFYSNVYVPPKSERVKGKPTHGVNLPSPTNLLAAHSSSAFFVAREDKSSFCCAFLYFYRAALTCLLFFLAISPSIRTSNDYRPERSSESFKGKDRCWNRPYHFQRLALFLRWDPESLVRLLASRDVTFDFEWLNGPTKGRESSASSSYIVCLLGWSFFPNTDCWCWLLSEAVVIVKQSKSPFDYY